MSLGKVVSMSVQSLFKNKATWLLHTIHGIAIMRHVWPVFEAISRLHGQSQPSRENKQRVCPKLNTLSLSLPVVGILPVFSAWNSLLAWYIVNRSDCVSYSAVYCTDRSEDMRWAVVCYICSLWSCACISFHVTESNYRRDFSFLPCKRDSYTDILVSYSRSSHPPIYDLTHSQQNHCFKNINTA